MSEEPLIPKHGGFRKLKSFQVSHRRNGQDMKSMLSIPSMNAEISDNAALVLTGVACTLLSRQIETLARQFENEGGFTERLYRVRSDRRRGNP